VVGADGGASVRAPRRSSRDRGDRHGPRRSQLVARRGSVRRADRCADLRGRYALARLTAKSGVDLWVAYVPQFTDPSAPEDWANQTAQNNGLGPHQYLLAISTDGRQYYLSGSSAGPVTGDELTTIERERVQPALSAGNWVGAATAAADGLADAIGRHRRRRVDAAGIITPILLVIVVIALAGLIIWIVIRSRRRRSPASSFRDHPRLRR
jgi:uncharacterized membrane protein YgcG